MKIILSFTTAILSLLSVSCSKEHTIDMSILQGEWELVESNSAELDKYNPQTLIFEKDICRRTYAESDAVAENEYFIDGHTVIITTALIGIPSDKYIVTRLDSKYLEFDFINEVGMPHPKEVYYGTYLYKRIK
jgi:hypothetical protein